MYETAWKRRGTGTQASTRRGVVAEGTWSPRGGPHGGRDAGRRRGVAQSLRKKRRGGVGGQAPSRAQTQTLPRPTQKVDPADEERSAGQRLPDRSVDPAPRDQIEWLPAYAPELHPVAQVWNGTQYTDLANYIPDDVLTLGHEVARSIRQTRSQQTLPYAFFRHCGLGL